MPEGQHAYLHRDARDTSTAAYLKALQNSSSQRVRVWNLLSSLPPSEGLTDEEMQTVLVMGANTQRPRRLELVEAGVVIDSGKRRPTSIGNDAIVWVKNPEPDLEKTVPTKGKKKVGMNDQEVGRLVAWASQECDWQHVGPHKVSYLIDAYFELQDASIVTPSLIRRLGSVVEPGRNLPGYWRDRDVYIGEDMGLHPAEIDEAINLWWASVAEGIIDATEGFRQFEVIHPFFDGNGRVGALLYNYLNGTYNPMALQFPPNLWNDVRREGVEL